MKGSRWNPSPTEGEGKRISSSDFVRSGCQNLQCTTPYQIGNIGRSQVANLAYAGTRTQSPIGACRTTYKRPVNKPESRDCGIDGHATTGIRRIRSHPRAFLGCPCCSVAEYHENFVNVAVAVDKMFREGGCNRNTQPIISRLITRTRNRIEVSNFRHKLNNVTSPYALMSSPVLVLVVRCGRCSALGVATAVPCERKRVGYAMQVEKKSTKVHWCYPQSLPRANYELHWTGFPLSDLIS
ncbi:hypothetical protein F4820DRAFT_215361 [Hypoxylon rubiginosum]|uniref:Uncharacterized protein n=1 Tax=Hypoxylon rubiginosum TaxID=110542 RepID=A0ACB9Z747_9PEZI|nr:hypothetical protein F4820DRAFT_215361 [Hypoxylon rubiginosum]